MTSRVSAPGVEPATGGAQPLPTGPFGVGHDAIDYVGDDLCRPECILAERDGRLLIADKRGTFTVLAPDGSQRLLGSMKSLPNGMALSRDGVLYVANIGDRKLYAVDPETGEASVLMESFDGKPLGSVNFVYVDTRDRIWVTVSTRTEPRLEALKKPVPTGISSSSKTAPHGSPSTASTSRTKSGPTRTSRRSSSRRRRRVASPAARSGPTARLARARTMARLPFSPARGSTGSRSMRRATSG